jgi:hypothetical protein
MEIFPKRINKLIQIYTREKSKIPQLFFVPKTKPPNEKKTLLMTVFSYLH